MNWLSAKDLALMRADAARLLPDLCSILSVSRTTDGEGGWVDTWTATSVNVPCRVDYVYGTETLAGGAVQQYKRAKLSLAHDAVLETSNRILVDGRTYAVTSVNNGQSGRIVVRAELEYVA